MTGIRRSRRSPGTSERGQILVIVAVGCLAMVAMVGLVIDGGYAWVRQRDTQNGADAVANAGTVVIQHYLAQVDSPPPDDSTVGCVVEATAASNNVTLVSAEYTDYQGQPFSPTVAVGDCTPDLGRAIPTGAQGVRATASEAFPPFLMQVIGVGQLTTVADATAVVGTPQAVPGGALPVTFPITSSTCDALSTPFTIRSNDGDATWEYFEIIDEVDADASNLAIIPLCDSTPGSVGWLDFGCGQNLESAVSDPCDIFIWIPEWIRTQTGNVNSLQNELDAYTGGSVGVAEPDDSVLSLPIHDFTCTDQDPDLLRSQPISDCPTYPTWSGQGQEMRFHVPWWVGFKLDAAYVAGGDRECQEAPGGPVLVHPQPPGKVGCLKGWFVDRYDEPGPIGLAPIMPGANVPMAVVLIQ
jgi:hypothetical protein